MDEDRLREMMTRSINKAEESVCEKREKGDTAPKVGAVLTDKEGKILMECARGETGTGHHCEYGLIEKAQKDGIDLKGTVLFVTLEPCTARSQGKTPCVERIVQSGIDTVYIGSLDPDDKIRGRGLLYLQRCKLNAATYPVDLGKEVQEKNKVFFEEKIAKNPVTPMFVTKNIAESMRKYMINKGGLTSIKEIRTGWDVTLDVLIEELVSVTGKPRKELYKIAEAALGHAFDEKYHDKTYKDDVRGQYKEWVSYFDSIIRETLKRDLKKLKTLVVGIGNGHEGRYLFEGISDLIIVDIAPKSLRSAKKILTPKEAYLLNAQDLKKIHDSSIDAYISLLTYQSAYFDIHKSMLEANRVLKNDGIIVISVSCGYIKNDEYFDGIFDQEMGGINRIRPYEISIIIMKELISLNFAKVGIISTPSEIFIYGEKNPPNNNIK